MLKKHCIICQTKANLLAIKGGYVCPKNSCAIKHYQKIGWLASNAPTKKLGRPRLHTYSSERERKAHYRHFKTDKTLADYFRKK